MKSLAIQKLSIPFIGDAFLSDTQAVGSSIRKLGVKTQIDKINWPDYPYQPSVKLYAGYSGSHLWLLYEVAGDFFRAKALVDQEAVWEDSCVEFFISTDSKKDQRNLPESNIVYRNFEFNSIGVAFSAVGTKFRREMLAPEEMVHIQRYPSSKANMVSVEGTEFDWELCVAIPLNLLGIHPGSSFRANFYKCGDLTKRAHFLSWSPIESKEPDFHLPRFFGEVELML